MKHQEIEFTDRYFTRSLRHKPDGINAFTDRGKNAVTGLLAEVAKNNTITFRVRKRVGVERHSQRIGSFCPPTLGVNEARAFARKIIAGWELDELNGITKAQRERERSIPTLASLISKYETARRNRDPDTCGKQWKPLPKDWQEKLSILRRMYAGLLTMRMDHITRDDLAEAHEAYLALRKRETGRAPERSIPAMWGTVQPMFTWASRQGWIARKEFTGFTEQSDARTRFLLPGELQAAIRGFEAGGDMGKLPLFLLYSCVRLRMATGMKFTELSPVMELETEPGKKSPAIIWTIPGSEAGRSKGLDEDDAGVFVIAGEALAIVEYFREQKRASGDDRETVFPLQVANRWVDNGKDEQVRLLAAVLGEMNWHRHDLRRTGTTYMNYALAHRGHRSVERRLISKKALNHHYGESVTDIYDQMDQYQDLAYGLLEMQGLLRDIATGAKSERVQKTIERIAIGATQMMTRYHVSRDRLAIKTTEETRA